MTAREKFLNRKDVRRKVIALYLGGGESIDVELRAVSIAASDRIAKAHEKSAADGAVQFLLDAVVDPGTGGALFQEADRPRLKELTQSQIEPLVVAFRELSSQQADPGKG